VPIWVQEDIVEDNEPEPRMDKVEDIRWKISTGYYDLDKLALETVVECLLRAFKKAE